jgi:hypothetical protein
VFIRSHLRHLRSIPSLELFNGWKYRDFLHRIAIG